VKIIYLFTYGSVFEPLALFRSSIVGNEVVLGYITTEMNLPTTQFLVKFKYVRDVFRL